MSPVAAAEWVQPTTRAILWSPLLGAAATSLGVGALVWLSDGPLGALFGLLAAVIASTVIAGLHDPAADLLAASPTSETRRRARRLMLLGPAAVLAWLVLIGMARLASPESATGWSVGPLIALTATGVSAATWCPARWAVTAGATVPLLWFACARLSSGEGIHTDLLAAWETTPWTVTAIALALVLIGARR